MGNYYADKLNAQSLFRVYDTAIPRVRQYLDAEIDFVRRRLSGTERVLEVAAGYGRIVRELAPFCSQITGIDISAENIDLSHEYLSGCDNTRMLVMDLHDLHFFGTFDVVLCLQNTLSATRASADDISALLALLSPGGTAYFSTYSEHFWEWRVKWFEEQVAKGCLGELDYEQTKDGVIVCKDGFRATTQTEKEFTAIGKRSGMPYELAEVDGSSLFLIVRRGR